MALTDEQVTDLFTRLDRIEANTEKALAQGAGPGAPAASTPTLMGPGIVTLAGGVKMHVLEPINAGYQPSMEEVTHGTPEYRHVFEPSNGDGSNAFPRRSESSYPWVYGKDGGGNLVAPGRIKFGGQTHANEAELFSAQARKAQRDANLAAYAEWLNNTPIDGLSQTQASAITADPNGLALMRHFDENATIRLTSAGTPPKNLDIFRKLLDGSHADMNRAISASYEGQAWQTFLSWKADPSKITEYLQVTPWTNLVTAYNRWIAGELA